MKNVSKNKFLTCFRPVADFDSTMHESRPAVDRSNSRRFSCIPLGDKHEKKNSETNTLFPEQGYQKFTENWEVPQPPKRRLVKVIKAMVVQTILNKRAQHKNRNSHDCFGSSKRGYSDDSDSSSTGVEKKSMKVYKDTKIKEIKAYKLCMSSSSSSSPSSESKKISKYDNNTKDQLEKKLDKFKCFGICLVLISLAVTILWGKYYGIIFTSIWLCFLSLWNTSYGKLRNTVSKAQRLHEQRT